MIVGIVGLLPPQVQALASLSPHELCNLGKKHFFRHLNRCSHVVLMTKFISHTEENMIRSRISKNQKVYLVRGGLSSVKKLLCVL